MTAPGKPASLLPHGSRPNAGTLEAQTLSDALQALPAGRVTVVLDACFAGAFVKPTSKVRYFVACRANEEALETEMDGQWQGLFTSALLSELESSTADWPGIRRGVNEKMAKTLRERNSSRTQSSLLTDTGGAPGTVSLKEGDVVEYQGTRFVVGASGQVPANASITVGRTTEVVRIALEYLGTPYQWGGSTKKGIDASHFIQEVFRRAGKPKMTAPLAMQEPKGKMVVWKPGAAWRGEKKVKLGACSVGMEALKPGDRLVFQRDVFSKERKLGTAHTGLYLGTYKNMRHAMIHASTSRGVVIVDLDKYPLWKDFKYALRD